MLNNILEDKVAEIIKKEKLTPIEVLEQMTFDAPPTVSLAESLVNPLKSHIIVEFKRKEGQNKFHSDETNAPVIVAEMIQGKATAIAFNMDEVNYGGKVNDLYQSKQLFPTIPMIYKDLIIDPYQIVEARAMGADAVFMEVSVLDNEKLDAFIQLAHILDMEVILQLNVQSNVAKLHPNADIICVSNYYPDNTFGGINQSVNIFPSLPHNKVKISSGGIQSHSEIESLLDLGYDGVIIGKSILQSEDINNKLAELTHHTGIF